MKTLETLEQEARQARENLIATIELGAPASLMADDVIAATIAAVRYADAYTLAVNNCQWINWAGGECPTDLPVDVRFRDGGEYFGEVYPRQYRWTLATGDEDSSLDIVAYRIVKGE